MRRTPLVALALATALAAPLFVFLASARNRSGEPEAEVELTERELRLLPRGEGRRWAVLRIDWNRELQWEQEDAGWFGPAKLSALGFDVSVPANDPRAPGFYGWQPAREVFLALEHDGPAAAAADVARPEGSPVRSRLHPVDADRDARALRARHPDRRRVLVVRAVVAPACHGRWDPRTRTHSPPFLRGEVKRLLVEELQVPLGRRALLDALVSGQGLPPGRGTASPAASPATGSDAGTPRYRVVLRTGRRFEPWAVSVSPFRG